MNDTVVNADGSTTTININREVVTIRGIIKGEYTINGHYYSVRSYDKLSQKKPIITVRVELHKVNPYSIAWVGDKEFTHRGQEETFLRFRLDENGKFLPPFTFEKKKFVTPMQELGNVQGPARPVDSSAAFSDMGDDAFHVYRGDPTR